MMKRILISLCLSWLLMISTQVQAYCQGNWLFGISGGYAETKRLLVIEMAYTQIPQFPLTGIFQEHTDNGPLLGILGGYQLRSMGWILGAELSLDWHDTVKKYDFAFSDVFEIVGWNGIGRNKRLPTVGLTGRLGFEMAPYFIPYMRLGLQAIKDDLNLTFVGNNFFPFSVKVENTRWQALFLAGFGAEFPLPFLTCPALRLEYNYMCYLKDNGLAASGIIPRGFNPSFAVHTHPRTQQGKISIVWNFY